MGIDVEIFVEAYGQPPDVPDWIGTWEPAVDGKCPPGATHHLASMQPYFGREDLRGPWPELSAVLMRLMGEARVHRIWYGPDTDIGPTKADPTTWTPFTLDDFVALTQHFLERR